MFGRYISDTTGYWMIV